MVDQPSSGGQGFEAAPEEAADVVLGPVVERVGEQVRSWPSGTVTNMSPLITVTRSAARLAWLGDAFLTTEVCRRRSSA